jgi:2-polyprenyl-3-methyl-5-hydroxy-6-metoxy-1,4-benzoquinol methylase
MKDGDANCANSRESKQQTFGASRQLAKFASGCFLYLRPSVVRGYIVAIRDFDCRRLVWRGFIPAKLTTQRKTQLEIDAVARTCPVCGGAEFEPHWQKGELRIVCCFGCGTVYANPAPVGMASGEYYDTEGAAYYLSPAKLESDYADVRFERELKLFREFCPRGAVLDVGCGSGAFLFQLNKHWPGDYEILGTDVSGAPLDYAESRGVPAARGKFLEMDFGGRNFDAITLWAVAEHLAEPKRFLEKANVLLKPGGVCFVLVPNLRSLAVRLLGAKYRYVYPQHLNYFSAQTLARLSENAGFEIVATRFTHFNPVVLWQDWRGGGREVSNQERGELLKRTTALKQKAWARPLKALYGLSEKTLAALGRADNVVVVLKKN